MNVGYIVFGVVGLLTLVCFMPPLGKWIKLPYSVLLAIVGCVLGFGLHWHGWMPRVIDDLVTTIDHFNISSDIILLVFLPVLLFQTALSMNVRRLMDDIAPILLMAVVAVVVCTIVVGVALNAASSYGIIVSLLLGAIVATTDPAAVVDIFHEVGAPKRLTTLVEGESLLNDAASIALYSVLMAALVDGATGRSELSAHGVFWNFLHSFVGGGLAGYVMGRVACGLFALLRGFPMAEITFTLALSYLSFIISDYYLGVSGVVATVVAGLVVGSTGRTRMSPTTFEHLAASWDQFGFWANSLVFLFASMLIPRLMAHAGWRELQLVLVVFAATLVARAVVVFGLLPLLSLAHLSAKVSRAYKIVMWWGGLRGAVSLALALAVTEVEAIPEAVRQFLGVAITSFVLMTLFFNGTTLRWLIGVLGLDQLPPLERSLRNQALTLALEDLQQRADEIANAEHINPRARERIHAVFETGLTSARAAQPVDLTLEQRVVVGLATAARHEEEVFFDVLKAQIVDRHMAEALLARAERLEDAIQAHGLAGLEEAIQADVQYRFKYRLALKVYRLCGWQRWLGYELAQRFANLMIKRGVAQQIIAFTHRELVSLWGQEVAQRIVEVHERRLHLIVEALDALDQQYPSYSLWLQESYLGRAARELERRRYRQMRDQFLISDEVYADLMRQLKQRWQHIDSRPPLEMKNQQA